MSETLTVDSYSGGAVTLAVKATRGDGWLDRVVTTCPGCFAQTFVPPECLPLTRDEHEAITGPCRREERGQACAMWKAARQGQADRNGA